MTLRSSPRIRVLMISLCLSLLGAPVSEAAKVPASKYTGDLLETQRELYEENRWQEFFGQALFYREVWLKRHKRVTKRHFNTSLIALEMSALIKHCQWHSAMRVGIEAMRQAKALGIKDTTELTKALKIVRLHYHFPEVHVADEESNGPIAAFTEELHWKIDEDQMSMIKDPRNLRVRVANECEGEDDQS